MRRLTVILILIFGLSLIGCGKHYVTNGPYIFPRQGSTWQCNSDHRDQAQPQYKVIRLGERYRSVLEKCGEPDDEFRYINDLRLRLGTKAKYWGKKLVISNFMNEFNEIMTERHVEEIPIYLSFDRWGICIKIQEGEQR